jgi:hypothetical protein
MRMMRQDLKTADRLPHSIVTDKHREGSTLFL